MAPEIPTRDNNTLGTLANLFVPKGGSTTTNTGGVTQTTSSQVSPEAVNAIVSQILSDPNRGLAAVSSGQRQAGMYNSTTNSLLTNDLIARAAGQAAALSKTETVSTQDNRSTRVKNTAPIKPGVGAAAIGLLQLMPKSIKDKLTESVLGNGASSAQANINPGSAAVSSGNSVNAYAQGGPSVGVFANDNAADLQFLDTVDSGLDISGSDIDLGSIISGGADAVDLTFLDNIGSGADLSGAVLDDSFWEDIFFADGGEIKSEKTTDKAKEAASVFGGMLRKAVKDLLETQSKREKQVESFADGGAVNTGTYGARNTAASGNSVDVSAISAPDVTNSLLVSALQGTSRSLNPARSRTANSDIPYESESSNDNSDTQSQSTGNNSGLSVSSGQRAGISAVAGLAGAATGTPGLGTIAGLATAQNNEQAINTFTSALMGMISPQAALAYKAVQMINSAVNSTGNPTPGVDPGLSGFTVDPGLAPATTVNSILGTPEPEMSTVPGMSVDIGGLLGNSGAVGQADAGGMLGGLASGDIGFADGGKIVGPGTGTSDSIPAVVKGTGKPIRVSNGEYILPKDVVDMLGVDNLDQLVATFHKPVRK